MSTRTPARRAPGPSSGLTAPPIGGAQPPRFDGYVRVSQVGDRDGARFMSPAVQRDEIVRWARLNGVLLDTVHVELDQSGARADRPLLQAALARIDAGTVQGLIVARLDRFGRSSHDAMAMITRIEQAGGSFVSVAECFDAQTFIGRFGLRILFSIAELDLDRIRETWATARARAIDRGSYLPPWLPVGYQADELRRLTPDPDVAPAVRRAFAMRVAGASYRDVGALLEQSGIRTPTGGRNWTSGGVIALLANRAYLGEIPAHDGRRIHAHPPLVDAPTWQSAQQGRALGLRASSRDGGPVSGLLRCAACRKPMTHHASRGVRQYSCRACWTNASCPNPAFVMAAVAEDLVERAFFTALAGRRPARPDRRLKAREKAARSDLERYRDHPGLLSVLGGERFQAGLEVRVARLERARRALTADRARVEAQRVTGTVADWELRWPKLDLVARRAVIAGQLDAAFIARGSEPIEQLFWAVRRGQAPDDLPQWRYRGPLRPFVADEQPLIRLRDVPDWTPGRIERALRAFLAGRDGWPTDADWLRDGGGPLLRQLDRELGRDVWARRIGVRPPRVPGPAYWTDARVRASITEVMRDRHTWPQRAEWQLLAPGGLWAAISPRNGEWAHEFGHQPPAERRPRRWTAPAIERTLLELAGPDRVYPPQWRFAEAGVDSLYTQLRRHDEHGLWAARLGLAPAPRELGVVRLDLSELNLLAHLRAAGPDGISARRLAIWLGDGEHSMRVAGRLRSLSLQGLCVRAHIVPGPPRWIATLPRGHPARSSPAPHPPPRTPRRRGTWPPDRTLEAMQDWADAHDRSPTYEDWRRSAPEHPCSSAVVSCFGTWSAALTAAGLPATRPGPRARAAGYSNA